MYLINSVRLGLGLLVLLIVCITNDIRERQSAFLHDDLSYSFVCRCIVGRGRPVIYPTYYIKRIPGVNKAWVRIVWDSYSCTSSMYYVLTAVLCNVHYHAFCGVGARNVYGRGIMYWYIPYTRYVCTA